MQDEILDNAGVAATESAAGLSRRRFLTYAGMLAGAGMLAASCGKDDTPAPVTDNTRDVGTGDVGYINFLYVHEQLASMFYERVCSTPYVDMGNDNLLLFRDILAHTEAHRELLKELLGADALPKQEINLEGINFTSPIDVFERAIGISDRLVMAYNAAIPRVVSGNYVSSTQKIASVKARHSAFVRNLQSFGNATNNDENGMEKKDTFRNMMEYSNQYFVNKLSAYYIF